MNDERQQTRSPLTCAAGIIGWVLFVAAVVLAFSLWRSLHAEKAALESKQAALKSEKTARESEKAAFHSEKAALESRLSEEAATLRQSKALLVPFTRMAVKQFPNAAADERLDLLQKRIAVFLSSRTAQEGTRFIGRDGVARLRAMLVDAPAFDVEIGCVLGDTDSLAISEELRAAFEAAGSKVREFVRYPAPPIKLRGVSIHSRPLHDDVLGNIIGQIFREVSQEKNQWVGKDEIGPLKPDGPEPDIRIFVGSK